MQRLLSTLITCFLLSSTALADNGIINVKSTFGVAKTADRFEKMLKTKGMTLFSRISHTDGAFKVGKQLRPTELFIFGNPKVGTLLMQCGQTIAIDLPQKALIWEDQKEQIWFSYNDPVHLSKRHSIKNCDDVVNKISNALSNFAKAATRE